MQHWIFVLLISVTTFAFADADTNITKDRIYGHKDGMALTYDVFTPANANGAGVAFMVSGGWYSVWMPAEQRLPSFRALLDAGYTVFAVHHGSAPRFKVPDAVSDVRAAIRHIKANADSYAIASTRLGVFGGSAGGHLSLMLGLNAESPPTEPVVESRGGRKIRPSYNSPSDTNATVAAVVAYFPPVDLRSIVGPSDRFPALDIGIDAAAAISPILFVDSEDPPVKLIHGDADTVVPLSNSTTLKAEMDKHGVENDLLILADAGHGFQGEDRSAAAIAMIEWFNKHLAAKKS
ncbi:MAG: acetyl esterase/lipase [Limisphaerales bacterium]|jgi:acetyl esterase/lipase